MKNGMAQTMKDWKDTVLGGYALWARDHRNMTKCLHLVKLCVSS